jgi:predicted transcriptional regulator
MATKNNAKEIKKLLIDKDIRQADIARKAQVTRVAICRVISGDLGSARLKRIIANMLGKTVRELWPDDRAA